MSEPPVDSTDEQEVLVWSAPEPELTTEAEDGQHPASDAEPDRRRVLPFLLRPAGWLFGRSLSARLAIGGLTALAVIGALAGFFVTVKHRDPVAHRATAPALEHPVIGGPEAGTRPLPGQPGAAVGNPVPAPAGEPVPAPGTGTPTSTATTDSGSTTDGKPAPLPGAVNPATETDAKTLTATSVTYHAIAGLGCTGAGTSYSRHGWFKNGNGGWWTLASGSTTEGGCNGQFDDMPTSGKADAATAGRAMVFGFRMGGGAQTCTLQLYIPSSPTVPTAADPGRGKRDVIVNPVHIAVMTGPDLGSATYSSPSGSRTVSQAGNHGSWTSLGSYPVRNGTIGVKITDRGTPWDYPVTNPHIAGGAVRANCTAA